MNQPKILIVEDDRAIAIYLRAILGRRGYRVIGMHETGEEAIAAAVAERPDLVLIDILLGGTLDGISVAEEIQKLIEAPFIYLTASCSAQLHERAMATGPAGYLTKPFRGSDLLAAVAAALAAQS